MSYTPDSRQEKKAVQKDKYEQKKMSKNELVQELHNEALDRPEEVYMGLGKKTKTSKQMDTIEAKEMENFKRFSMSNKEKQ